ncbi:unnamed protein product [Pleuronectes platessa]|uniref:Uncharacterized protein n=1 Tax=Pleuronectes platessa TaxID=8262 RepID=A0A9N7TWF1_PLEPL|nr:unnamed protein product [Pleuronectes platessa]
MLIRCPVPSPRDLPHLLQYVHAPPPVRARTSSNPLCLISQEREAVPTPGVMTDRTHVLADPRPADCSAFPPCQHFIRHPGIDPVGLPYQSPSPPTPHHTTRIISSVS